MRKEQKEKKRALKKEKYQADMLAKAEEEARERVR
jgi:hypothetical protein